MTLNQIFHLIKTIQFKKCKVIPQNVGFDFTELPLKTHYYSSVVKPNLPFSFDYLLGGYC